MASPTKKKQILEDEIPKEYLVNFSGKDYIILRGLLTMAHNHGLTKIITSVVERDADRRRYEVIATVDGERGTFTGHGEADPSSVKRGFDNSLLRMAETRAIVRALRWYCGIGITALDELGPEPGEEAGPAVPRPANTDNAPARTTGENQIKNARATGDMDPCPWCNGRVWDNRDAKANKENTRPAVYCMARDACLGGVKNAKDAEGFWQIVELGAWKQWEYDPSKWTVPRNCPPKGYPIADKQKWIDESNGKQTATLPVDNPTPATPDKEADAAPDWDQKEIPF